MTAQSIFIFQCIGNQFILNKTCTYNILCRAGWFVFLQYSFLSLNNENVMLIANNAFDNLLDYYFLWHIEVQPFEISLEYYKHMTFQNNVSE